MDDELKQLVKATLAVSAVGIVAGAAYVALLSGIDYWVFSLNAAIPVRGVVVLCLLVFGALGFVASKVAEHVAGFCGEILLVPIGISALIGLALGWIGGNMVTDLHPQLAMFGGLAFLAYVGVAGARAIIERLR